MSAKYVSVRPIGVSAVGGKSVDAGGVQDIDKKIVAVVEKAVAVLNSEFTSGLGQLSMRLQGTEETLKKLDNGACKTADDLDGIVSGLHRVEAQVGVIVDRELVDREDLLAEVGRVNAEVQRLASETQGAVATLRDLMQELYRAQTLLSGRVSNLESVGTGNNVSFSGGPRVSELRKAFE